MDRSDLLTNIQRIFIQYGYDGASLVQLAQGTGLSKASLYHHYPGGKLEMGRRLIEQAIADLEQHAFRHLINTNNAEKALSKFIRGFIDYAEARGGCILCVFGVTRSGSRDAGVLNDTIREQLADWHHTLAATFMRMDMKPKKANRQAHQLLASLWGALVLSQLNQQTALFRALAEREIKALSA